VLGVSCGGSFRRAVRTAESCTTYEVGGVEACPRLCVMLCWHLVQPGPWAMQVGFRAALPALLRAARIVKYLLSRAGVRYQSACGPVAEEERWTVPFTCR
jgi:hypothetical protein